MQDDGFGGGGDFASGFTENEPPPRSAADRVKSVTDGPGLFGDNDMLSSAKDKKPTKIGLFDDEEDQDTLAREQ